MRQRRADGDVAGQVLVLGAESVGDPRPHARPDERVAAGVQFEQRSAVPRVRAPHRIDHAQVIDVLSDMRKQIADPRPALAVLPKLPRRLQQVSGRRRENSRLRKRQRLPMIPFEQRLVIERVDLRRPTVHEEKNDSPRLRWKQRSLRSERIRRARRVRLQEVRQRERPEPARRSAQHSTPGKHWFKVVVRRLHGCRIIRSGTGLSHG